MRKIINVFKNGYVVGGISLILSFVLLYIHISVLNIIPDIVFVAVVAIDLIFLLLYYLVTKLSSRYPQVVLIVFQYIKILSTILLIAFLFWTNKQIESVALNATDNSKIYLVVAKNSIVNGMEDINERTIYYSKTTSEYSIDKIETKLKEKKHKNQFLSLNSYNGINTMLQNNNESLFLIEGAALPMIEQSNKDIRQQIKIISTFKKEKKPVKKKNIIFNNNKPFTVFISGIDVAGDPTQDALSDVDILLFLYPDTKTVKMTSIPRDTYVENPALNNGMDKFTHTGVSGVDNTVTAAENFFDIDIDYYSKVSFTSLEKIVDIIDGIEVDVELQFCEQNANRSFRQEDLICLEPGMQKLNGAQALAYARHRKTEGYNDQGRNRAQQKIISAIINKLLTVTNIQKVPEVINLLSSQISTNMPKKDILSFTKSQLQKPTPWTFETLTTIEGSGDMQPTASMGWDLPLYVWQPDMSSVEIVRNEFLNNCKKYDLKLARCQNLELTQKGIE